MPAASRTGIQLFFYALAALFACVAVAEARASQDPLLFLHARMTDPELGRFISPDPLTPGSQLGLNRYSYSFNTPATSSDATGLDPDLSLDDLIGDVRTNPRMRDPRDYGEIERLIREYGGPMDEINVRTFFADSWTFNDEELLLQRSMRWTDSGDVAPMGDNPKFHNSTGTIARTFYDLGCEFQCALEDLNQAAYYMKRVPEKSPVFEAWSQKADDAELKLREAYPKVSLAFQKYKAAGPKAWSILNDLDGDFGDYDLPESQGGPKGGGKLLSLSPAATIATAQAVGENAESMGGGPVIAIARSLGWLPQPTIQPVNYGTYSGHFSASAADEASYLRQARSTPLITRAGYGASGGGYKMW